jgi:hypothetical protein
MLLEKNVIFQKNKPQHDANFWEILSKIQNPGYTH